MPTIVNIDVPDLERAIEFYGAALGLALVRKLDGDVAELGGATGRLFLLQKADGTLAAKRGAARRGYGRHWTPVHVDFVVDDVDAAAERAVRAGAVRESERVEWLGSRCITLSDPFGHGFCVIEFDGDTYADSA
jgi:predicted enzyme related to lactoylglutathione lyase